MAIIYNIIEIILKISLGFINIQCKRFLSNNIILNIIHSKLKNIKFKITTNLLHNKINEIYNFLEQIYMRIIIFMNQHRVFLHIIIFIIFYLGCSYFNIVYAEDTHLVAATSKKSHILQGQYSYITTINKDNNISFIINNHFGLGPATKSHLHAHKWFVPFIKQEDLILRFQAKLDYEAHLNVNINQLLYEFSQLIKTTSNDTDRARIAIAFVKKALPSEIWSGETNHPNSNVNQFCKFLPKNELGFHFSTALTVNANLRSFGIQAYTFNELQIATFYKQAFQHFSNNNISQNL